MLQTLKSITERLETCEYKRWVKIIPTENPVMFDTYNQNHLFTKVANIVLDNDTKPCGKKARNTVIRFEPTIDRETFNKKAEWLYIFTIDGQIVKIGGTRDGLKGRQSSYLCGHHIPERNKSGDCSKTNGFIYNTFDFYLGGGSNIEMWGYELPTVVVSVDICGKPVDIVAQTYHAYESTFMTEYENTYGSYPFLCDNCDPGYKSGAKPKAN